MRFTPTRCYSRARMVLGVLIFLCLGQLTQAQTTSFTYQGKLSDNGGLANGGYDMQFKLFDIATVGTGTQLGSNVTLSAVQVTNGIFTVQLDFGAGVFPGASRFLEIAVKQSGGASFTVLAPRQPVSSNPYAIRSLNSMAADGLSVACVNCVTSSQILNVQGAQISGPIPLASVPAGSANYIQNTTTQQASANFNISGNGTTGGTLSGNVVNSATQYNIGGNRVLAVTGGANTFAGVAAGAVTTADSNSFFGSSAGASNTSGSSNSFFGASAGASNTTGFANTFFGSNTGASNSTGATNSFFGTTAGQANTIGVDNAFFGVQAGFANQSGNSNSFFGRGSGTANTASNNSFFGYNSGRMNTTGTSNTFFGFQAGTANTTGGFNSFFGSNAGAANTTAINNSLFGQSAGSHNTTGHDNTFVGNSAGLNITTASNNTMLGSFAGQSGNGANNTFLGYGTGNLNSGNGNSYVGYLASGSVSLTNATAIGANAFAGQSNSIILGSINGINGSAADTAVGIGTTTPEAKLHIKSEMDSDLLVLESASTTSTGLVINNTSPAGPVQNHKWKIFTHGGLSAGVGSLFIRDETKGITALEIAPALTTVGLILNGGLSVGGKERLDELDNGGDTAVCWNSSPDDHRLSVCSSSRRYKTDVQSYSSGLALINRLNPVTFRWKSTSRLDLGFVAEEVAAVEPLLATHNSSGDIEGVKYDRISAALVNAVKEQQEQIASLQRQIAAQQLQIDQLKTIQSAKLKAQANRSVRGPFAGIRSRLKAHGPRSLIAADTIQICYVRRGMHTEKNRE